MPNPTLPHTPRAKRVLRAVQRPSHAVFWAAFTVLGTVCLLSIVQSGESIWSTVDVQATMDAAREAKLVELCGGTESVRLPLANGDVQCYTKRGKKTAIIKKESLK
jgi:hypothetical protein